MILVKMMGGLGNQLFQYSFARFLERKLGKPVWLDTLFFLNQHQRRPTLENLGIRYRRSPGDRYLWYRLNSRRFLRWEENDFDPSCCDTGNGKSMFFWGYWQRAEYADAGREGILEGFRRFKKRPEVKRLSEEILAEDSVSIHVRRGDYRGIPKFRLLGPEYYDKALNTLNVQSGSKIFLFSDERGVEKELFPNNTNLIRVSDFGLRDFEEFYLMSLCRRNVAANSTFSWWASFLNTRKGRSIVLPKVWTTVPGTFDITNYIFNDVQVV